MTRDESFFYTGGYIHVIPGIEQLLNENLPRSLLAFGCKKRMKLRKGDSARGMGKRGRADEDPSAAREEPRNKSTMRRPEYQIKRQKPSAARVIRVILATCTGTGLPDDSAEESGRRERPGLYGIRKERVVDIVAIKGRTELVRKKSFPRNPC